jgi:hypothetical protein
MIISSRCGHPTRRSNVSDSRTTTPSRRSRANDHRKRIGTRIPLELTVFVTAALGLLVTGADVWAVVYLALVVINAALLTVLRQWEA